MRSRPSDSTDPLDRWEQRQQSSRSSSSRMSPRARALAEKHASTAGRESRGGLGVEGWLRAIVVAVLVSPFAGGCGAVVGGMVGGQAGMIICAAFMVVAAFALSIGASQWAQERKEIHQHRLRRARGEE